ncbi:hypothetical protein CRG98_032434 [Punica granatum]|uniref:DUF7745 domain-containing protein n=1 Tax=Punica granatum TaxID=22663 RepID=A0A2I0ITU7_PUNGR|nr:hypothetical protein CRG98_032434 [Punica granatum]
MARLVSFPHLDRITPPLEEISHIWAHLHQVNCDYISTFVGDIPILAMCRVDWNFLGAAVTFWDPVHAVFNIQGTELTPTIEEYRTLVGRIAATRGIVEPNFHTTRLVSVSRLLGMHRSQLQAELAYSGGTEIVTAKLLRFIEIRTREVLDAWRTVITERPYFPEHPTQDKRDFQATEEYILRFYRWGPSENDDFTDSPPVESSASSGAPVLDMTIQTELANLRAERDRLRREIAEKNEQLGDQHPLQKELAQARAQLHRRDQELAQANVALESSPYKLVKTSFAGRLTATFTLPPRQGEPWLEDRCTFLGKASFSLTPRNQASSRDRTHLFAQLSTSINTTECIFPRRASMPPPYPCTHPRPARMTPTRLVRFPTLLH